MRILLSNDDGILAPGLAALRAAVADLGEISIVAPDSPQSAAGHAITLKHPLTVQRVGLGAPEKFWGISVDGRPADCVRLAIRELLDKPPELVLSGINAGQNVGINVFYSGTVAAAAEAAMFNIPAVAFSAATTGGEIDFERAASGCRKVLDRLLAGGLSPGDLINVNVPALAGGEPKGVQVVRQSTAGLEDVYRRRVDGDGGESYRLGDVYKFLPGEADCDVAALADGYITVTPLQVDMTRGDRLKTLKRIMGQ
ncbi:MAG: 5'/3'-nucleotidase SurE [Planctomycetota bacterium]|nr:5'/3'-nucleotidase SurE [Planctomycetota bacterium]